MFPKCYIVVCVAMSNISIDATELTVEVNENSKFWNEPFINCKKSEMFLVIDS